MNKLSNQDFAGLDKFRLKESLGKMKEMHAHLVKANKSNRNETNLSKLFSSTFPPAMPKPMPMGNILPPLAARENASLTLKKESLCWKVSFRHRLKKFLLYRDCFFIEYVHSTGNSESIKN